RAVRPAADTPRGTAGVLQEPRLPPRPQRRRDPPRPVQAAAARVGNRRPRGTARRHHKRRADTGQLNEPDTAACPAHAAAGGKRAVARHAASRYHREATRRATTARTKPRRRDGTRLAPTPCPA